MFADAPFADRPLADSQAIVGFADGNADVSATFKYVIYAATRQFATNADDSVAPSRPFLGTLDVPLNFKWSILGGDIGTFATGDGTSVLDNSDGAYDNLPSTFTADGRPITVKALRLGDDYGSAFTIFRGVMASWFIDESQVAVQIRGFDYKLSVPAQPTLYGGTGGVDGGTDLAQKRKPMFYGYGNNWTPVLLDSAFLTYQAHDGPINAITAVYDSGAALTFAADYADYAALTAAAIPAGGYATCLALGIIRLNANPEGQVTVDLQGDKTGGTFVYTTGDILRRWIMRVSEIVDPTDLYEPSFDALNISQPAPVGYGIGPDDNHTIADVAADLMHGIGGWCGFRKDGLLEIQTLTAPTDAPIAYFNRAEIIDIKREQLPSSLVPPPFRQRVPYQRNWTKQSTFAGSVTAARKSYLSSDYLLSEASDIAIKTDHPFAQDPQVRECYFRDQADSDAEALRLLTLYRVERALYRMTLPRRALHLNLGETINITYSRWDLSLGRNMTILELGTNLQRPREGQIDTVEVVAYG